MLLEICKETYQRWHTQYGEMKSDQANRFKELEIENSRLKQLLADAELDKAMRKEVREGVPSYDSINVHGSSESGRLSMEVLVNHSRILDSSTIVALHYPKRRSRHFCPVLSADEATFTLEALLA